jgi:hypothetical protein
MSQNNKITIELGDKVAVLSLQDFDATFEIDDLLRIDYGNIMGEILTWPLIYNRISNLRAEQEYKVEMLKLDTKIFEAGLTEKHRKALLAGGTKATVQEVESAVRQDPSFLAQNKRLLLQQKNYAYIDSLYWSAQSKDQKLNKLIDKIHHDTEKELIEGVINGVLIKWTKKAIA